MRESKGRLALAAVVALLALVATGLGVLLVLYDGTDGQETVDDGIAFFAVAGVLVLTAARVARNVEPGWWRTGAVLAAVSAFVIAGHTVYDPRPPPPIALAVLLLTFALLALALWASPRRRG